MDLSGEIYGTVDNNVEDQNLGTGGDGFHGPFEHITVEGMDLSVEIVKKIIKKM